MLANCGRAKKPLEHFNQGSTKFATQMNNFSDSLLSWRTVGRGKNIRAPYLNWDLSQNERASGLEQFLSSAPLPQSVIWSHTHSLREKKGFQFCANFKETWANLIQCADTDTDQRIRTAGKWIWILLFSSAAHKMPTKDKFFFAYYW
jgi:hypothetical protein